MAKTFCPRSSSFWCKCEAVMQVRMRGGGGPGEMQLRDFFVRPNANPKCSQGWKQKQHGCCTSHVGPFNRCTFCHTKALRAFSPHCASRIFPLLMLVEIYTDNDFSHHGSSADGVTGCTTRLLGDYLSDEESDAQWELSGWLLCLYEASVHGGMWLGLGNFTVD